MRFTLEQKKQSARANQYDYYVPSGALLLRNPNGELIRERFLPGGCDVCGSVRQVARVWRGIKMCEANQSL